MSLFEYPNVFRLGVGAPRSSSVFSVELYAFLNLVDRQISVFERLSPVPTLIGIGPLQQVSCYHLSRTIRNQF